jgi:hypothetical protein
LKEHILACAYANGSNEMLELKEQRELVDAAIGPGLVFSIAKTAQIMRRHPVFVRGLLNSGQIRFIQLGGRRMIPRAAILNALTHGT